MWRDVEDKERFYTFEPDALNAQTREIDLSRAFFLYLRGRKKNFNEVFSLSFIYINAGHMSHGLTLHRARHRAT